MVAENETYCFALQRVDILSYCDAIGDLDLIWRRNISKNRLSFFFRPCEVQFYFCFMYLTAYSPLTVVGQLKVVPSHIIAESSLPARLACNTVLSDLSSCLHCVVVSGLARESATFASSSSFNQHFTPHSSRSRSLSLPAP